MTKEERENLIKKNMWVVDHFIKDYKHLMSYNELKSAGLYGLIKGVDRYKPNKGTKPSTYIRYWVKAEVLSSLYENNHMPKDYFLMEAYPNPFNPVTTLQFSLPQEAEVILEVYNIQGRVIETLIRQHMIAGYHSITWDADEYASGIYFIKMMANEYVDMQKLMLVK